MAAERRLLVYEYGGVYEYGKSDRRGTRLSEGPRSGYRDVCPRPGRG